MDEIIAAVDAYVTRRVEEVFEHRFRTRLVAWMTAERPTFDMLVKEAVMDKPWFDEAIATLVAENTPVPAPAQALTPAAPASREIDMSLASNQDVIRTFIKRDDNLREFLADVVGDECYDRIRDMSFSVSVD